MRDVIERLDGGLILRRERPEDTEALCAFNAAIHGNPEQPDRFIEQWTRRLLTTPHPTFGEGGFLVVEDPATGQIVSTLNLIPQTWRYADVPFGVGRIELVGTHPDYRRRGLVRRQMEEAHRWSAALGHPVQMITGISNFYRQFGYEQGLTMGGARGGFRSAIPPLAEGATEPFRIRPATMEDAEFLAALEERVRLRYLLSVPRDAALWRYELERLSDEILMGRRVRIIETAEAADPDLGVHVRTIEGSAGGPAPEGERVGYLVHLRGAAPTVCVTAYELAPGVSWLAVTPSVLRYLKEFGESFVPERPEHADRRFERFQFQLGLEHPVYRALPQRLPETERQFVNYVRVPDLPAFLMHVAPVLERRLAESVAVGHTGRLRLSFYRDGVLLRLEKGRLVAAEPCPHHASTDEAGPIGARFPGLTFLQLLLGCRSLEELEHAFGDVRALSDEARVLVTALFPKQPSLIWPVS